MLEEAVVAGLLQLTNERGFFISTWAELGSGDRGGFSSLKAGRAGELALGTAECSTIFSQWRLQTDTAVCGVAVFLLEAALKILRSRRRKITMPMIQQREIPN